MAPFPSARKPIMRFWRRTERWQPSSFHRPISILCRGKEIEREELFRYSNGRFLVNEDHACARRHTISDVEQLCTIASSVGQRPPVVAIEKMEGGFSKALLLKKQDGTELIAKIPFVIAGPPKYTTASEAAVLGYVRLHTGVPVPKVFAWSDDSSNPVGAEYIIMEKAPGTQLFNKREKMAEIEQFKLIQALAKLEGELTRLKFPANGSLYLRDSLPNGIALDQDMDPFQQFCIGQSCERIWSQDSDTAEMRSLFKSGPWSDLPSFGIALIGREMSRIEQASKADRTRPGSAGEQIAVLDVAKKVISLIGPSSLFLKASRPALWHTDLPMGNISVSDADPTQIVSLIDWQSIVISPLLLQARFPEFLSVGPSSSYEFGMDFPQLPYGFDSLDEEDKKIVELKHVQAKMAKGYELATGGFNIEAYRALSIPLFLQEFFLTCADASDGGTVPLRNCLMEILEGWDDLGFISDAPLTFDSKTLHKHSQDLEKYRDIHKVQEIARDALCTDSEGWIAPQLDFKVKRQENKALIEYAMAHSADYNVTPEEIQSIWPFKDI